MAALAAAVVGAAAALSARRSVEHAVARLGESQRATERAVEQLTAAVAKSQAWFWTPDWQKGEREADGDLAAGRFDRCHSLEDMEAGLNAAAERHTPSSAGA